MDRLQAFSSFRDVQVIDMNIHYTDAEILEVKQAWLRDNLIESSKRNIAQGRRYHGREHYICPLCGHDEVYKPLWNRGYFHCCEESCGFSGDGFAAEASKRGLTYGEALRAVMEEYGYGAGQADSQHKPTRKPKPVTVESVSVKRQESENGRDALAWAIRCRGYLAECAARFKDSPAHENLEKRGLSFETCLQMRFGYDRWSFKRGNGLGGSLGFAVPSIITPYNARMDYFGGRLFRPIGKTKFLKPVGEEAGLEPLYNCAALYGGADVVVISEGPFDVATVIQVAKGAGLTVGVVGLIGTASQRLIDALKQKPTKAKIVIALDDDAAGHAGALRAAQELDAMGANYGVWANGYGGFKDWNDLLQADSALARDYVRDMVRDAQRGYLLEYDDLDLSW